MDILTIVYIGLAALIGAAITSFFVKKRDTPQGLNLEEFVPKEEVQMAEQDFRQRLETINSQKEYAEKLQKEAQEKSEELSKQLNRLMSEGGIDEDLQAKFQEVEKLKKKIKSLEEELEDNEEDLDDAKKKIKNKTEDNKRLQEELSLLERTTKQTQEELNHAKEELERKAEELNLKMESLTFVQNILSAPEFSDSMTSNLYSKVDILSNFIQGELYDTIKSIWDIPKDSDIAKLFGEDLKRWEAVQKKSWIANKTALAFVGEFSAGKTSIVNRILSQDDPNVPKLPVSTKATTAIPTYISGGVKTDYKFFTQDNKLKKIAAEDFNRVTKEVLDQVGGVSNLIKYFVMAYKNENLKNLSILDTPGFNSNDKEDSERTLEVINECDALFWVFDVNAGTVNKSSIDLIKKHLNKPLYIIINKVDTKADSEVDKVEKLIKDTFVREKITVEGFIRFSAQAPLSNIMTPIKAIKRTSQEEDYLNTVTSAIEEAMKSLQEQTKDKKAFVDKCINSSNDLVEKFNAAIQATHADCESAINIPQWTEHIFSKDRYEMDQNQYNKLYNMLEQICTTRMDSICNLYNEQMETMQEGQDAWRDYQQILSQNKQIEECITTLKKYIKNIKQ